MSELRQRRARRLVILPTLVTLGNLAAGFLAINYVGDYVRDVTAAGGALAAGDLDHYEQLLDHGTQRLWLASWLIFVGMLFDALDGYVARLTRQQSDFGVELDSICDVITFGIAPAFLAKSLIVVELAGGGDARHVLARDRFAWAFATLYAVCAACRLARFNVDTDEEDSHSEFVGLPSPAAAGVVAGVAILYLTLERQGGLWLVHAERIVLLLAGLAMVSRIRYHHFVNSYLVQRIRAKNTVVVGGVLLGGILIFPEYIVPAGAILYFLSGPVYTLRQHLHTRRLGRTPERAAFDEGAVIETAYIALGSNLGDRSRLLDEAIADLRESRHVRVVAESDRMESDAVGGPPDQPHYLNGVVEVQTDLEPYELLAELHRIEEKHGRIRQEHWGPRTLDLDLLLYGDREQGKPVILPHPRLAERRFVLSPLAQIAPDRIVPGLERTVAELLLALDPETPEPAESP